MILCVSEESQHIPDASALIALFLLEVTKVP